MKKLFFSVLLFLVAMTGWAQDPITFTQGNFTYTVTDEVNKTVSIAKAAEATLSGALTIPSSVTYESVPYAVTSVGESGFYGTGITSVTIPASIMSIGNLAFSECNNMNTITIADSENALTMSNEWGYRPFANSATTIYIGRNLTLTADANPICDNVTNVTFGDKVTTINPYIFCNNVSLSSITIGEGVTSIGDKAFYWCGRGESVEETVVEIGSKSDLTSIGASAFVGCTKLKSVTLPSTLTTIGANAFDGSGLTSITIPASVTTIGNLAFAECNSMNTITIADSENALTMSNEWEYRPFANSATTIYIGRDLTLINSGENPICNNVTNVTFGDKVTTINPYIFSNNESLSSITIGEGVTSIGDKAFYWCGRGESVEETVVEIGSKSDLTSIGASAFGGCTKLKSVTLPSTLTTIGANAFDGSGLTSITIPASVTTIGNLAFAECNSMNTITIADSDNALTMSNEWGYRPFANSATTIYIGRDLTLINSGENPICHNVTNVTFGDKVTTINPYIFCNNESLSSITIGEGVTSIGDKAFYWCGNGESVEETVVEIGSKSDLTSIGASAFGGCTKLKSVTLPSTLTTIGANAFDGSGLTSITIPASVTTIGNAAFQNCNSMNTITIADSDNALTMSNEWGYRPFANSATTIYIGRNLTLTADANQICDNVTNVTFGDKVTTINPYLFSGTTTITSVKVPWLTPLTLNETAFNSSAYENATLWIPGGTEAAYQNGDNNWKNFENKNFSSYVVSITGSAHGTLAVADKTSTNGNTETMLIDRETDVVFTVTPATGYELTTFTVNGTAQTPTNGSYTVEKLLVDQTVVATFTPIAYPISYNLANGSLATANPASYTIESQAITLNNPTREGYDFAGWTGTGLNAATTSVTIAVGSTGERSYTATWTPKTYNITYTLNGGTVATANPASYTIESPAITLNNPTKTGYTFRGWKQNNEGDAMMSVVIAAGSTGNKAYTATWEVNQYTISFNSNGGSSVASITQNYGTAVVAPADPTRDGYTFGGWSPAIPSTMPAENMTLVAQWTTNHYTVSITGAGVTADNYSPEYGDDVVITIAEDEDRELTSLTVNGNNVTSAIVDGRYTINNVTSNVTVVATFNATKEFIEMAHGQMTFCCTRDLDFSGVTGIKAYIASGYNKTTGQVLLTQVESVPANTGLLLLGTEGVTYKVPYTTSDEYYVNLFQPVTEAQTVPATSGGYTNFLYGMVGGNEGFFKSSGEGTVAAGKAYLQLPTSAIPAAGKGIGLLFDDMATAIENVNSESGNDSVYDLSGRKVNADQKLTRGIYIINGKTVMIK